MITKTITIDEKKIYDELVTSLEKSYTLAYADYRDEIPVTLIQKCIDTESIYPLSEEDFWLDARDSAVREIIDTLMADKGYSPEQREMFQGTPEYENLRYEIEDRDISTPERDAFNNTRCHAYLRFHSNYDCWLPLWEQGSLYCEGTALAGILAALSLNPAKVRDAAHRRGINTAGRWRNIPSREAHAAVGYDAFINVLIETPNYGNWSFFGSLDMRTLWDILHNPRKTLNDMIIPAGTDCAMYNWWNGGGSLDFCKTLLPLPLSTLARRLAPYKDSLKVVVDEFDNEEYGYVPRDVYGGYINEKNLLTA